MTSRFSAVRLWSNHGACKTGKDEQTNEFF